MDRKRLWTLVFLLVAAGALILLISSISQLELLESRPFPFQRRPANTPPEFPRFGGGEILLLVIQGFIALSLALLPVYLIYSLLSPKGRKRLLRDMVYIGSILLILYFFSRLPINETALDALQEAANQGPDPFAQGREIEPAYPLESLNWLSPVLSLGLAVILSGMIILGLWFFWQRRIKFSETPLERIAEEVEIAIEDLRAGSDLRELIIRCYAQMTKIVFEQKGVKRGIAVTAREFEGRLHELGLPAAPVHSLTQLFEAARYGKLSPERNDEQSALASLEAIVEACRVEVLRG